MATVVRVAETRAMLNALGPRPEPLQVDEARRALCIIDKYLADHLQSIALEQRSEGVEEAAWEASLEAKKAEATTAAEEERLPYKSIIQLDELHKLYATMIKTAESAPMSPLRGNSSPMRPLYISDDIEAEVAAALNEAHEQHSPDLQLSGRRIARLPDSMGSIKSLVMLNLSNNLLKCLPDSISGLCNLVTLDVSSNQFISLPDSIGKLKKLRLLNVSRNALKTLPETLSQCYSLVELDASFNQLEKLPSNIGYLFNLQGLSVQLNKLNLLPASIGELGSLKKLEIHFNQLLSLPSAIGSLQELEILNCSSNFNSLTSLPSSIGDLSNLTQLDLSYNQIRELPISFGRLRKLRELKLDQNPLVVPPQEVVDHSIEAVLEYMSERWRLSLKLDDETADKHQQQPQQHQHHHNQHRQAGPNSHRGFRMISWLGGMCGDPSNRVLNCRSADRYLEQL